MLVGFERAISFVSKVREEGDTGSIVDAAQRSWRAKGPPKPTMICEMRHLGTTWRVGLRCARLLAPMEADGLQLPDIEGRTEDPKEHRARYPRLQGVLSSRAWEAETPERSGGAPLVGTSPMRRSSPSMVISGNSRITVRRAPPASLAISKSCRGPCPGQSQKKPFLRGRVPRFPRRRDAP